MRRFWRGHNIYESLVVPEPRSTTPWWIGPALYVMVTLVEGRACIEEREHTRNQKARFVHRHGVWSGKNRCCLAVLAGAVGKKQRIVRRE